MPIYGRVQYRFSTSVVGGWRVSSCTVSPTTGRRSLPVQYIVCGGKGPEITPVAIGDRGGWRAHTAVKVEKTVRYGMVEGSKRVVWYCWWLTSGCVVWSDSAGLYVCQVAWHIKNNSDAYCITVCRRYVQY